MYAALESKPKSDRLATTVEHVDGCCCSGPGQKAASSHDSRSSTQVGMVNRKLRRTLDIYCGGLKEAIWDLTGIESRPPASHPSFVAFLLSSWHRSPSFSEGYGVVCTMIAFDDGWRLQNSFRPEYSCPSASLYGIDRFERHNFLPPWPKHGCGGSSQRKVVK